MSDSHPAHSFDRQDKRTFLQKVVEFIHPSPDSAAELIRILTEAQDNNIISAESRTMLERVIRMADTMARDVMVVAPHMDVLDINAPLDSLLEEVIATAHSRFPVYEGERENIIGILMAKDLLKLQRTPGLNIRTLLRPATFVPETKGLNDLLREFQGNRNHSAVVIDEFGRVAGLVTIEDVLEEIVGEIEDEFDTPQAEGHIFSLSHQAFKISGDTPVERVAEVFSMPIQSSTPDTVFETIGGLITHEIGYMPKRGEEFILCGLRFTVLHTKGGAVRWLKVSVAT